MLKKFTIPNIWNSYNARELKKKEKDWPERVHFRKSTCRWLRWIRATGGNECPTEHDLTSTKYWTNRPITHIILRTSSTTTFMPIWFRLNWRQERGMQPQTAQTLKEIWNLLFIRMSFWTSWGRQTGTMPEWLFRTWLSSMLTKSWQSRWIVRQQQLICVGSTEMWGLTRETIKIQAELTIRSKTFRMMKVASNKTTKPPKRGKNSV